jgi:serine/threonine-protein kinase
MSDEDILRIARERVGRVLLGKYRLEKVLGVGGMAAVYLATHRNAKQFALKMLHPEISMRENIRTRFLREGYVANSVKHPGAVAVMDDDVTEDGSAFLVMELLEGLPVDELWARAGKRLPLPVALSVADALLDVLAAAHARGIVHRDLKPPNLFITHDGALKVLDFGIARLLDDTSGGQVTATGAMMGTPAFMAPEQALAKASEVDGQTDLWAVGATIFSLLTGQFVHTGDNGPQLLVNAATKPARSIGEVATDVPPAIATVIDRALAFGKGDRWASATEMRDALRAACVEATGAPIPPLPRGEAAVSALANTYPPPPEQADAYAPTVDSANASVPSVRGGVTTAGPVATSRALEATSSTARASSRRLWLGAAAVVGVVATGLAVKASHAPRVELCAWVNETLDGPRCGAPVDPAMAHRRLARTAAATTTGGEVTAFEWRNFAGTQADGDDLTRTTITRDADGHVVEVVVRDHHGNELRHEKWSDGGKRVDLVEGDGSSPRTDGATRVTTVRREIDAQGRVTKEVFFGPTGQPRADADGAYGYEIEYGSGGRWVRRRVLGADGKPGADEQGVGVRTRSDDETPEGREQTTLGLDERPMAVDGVFRELRQVGPDLDVTEQAWFAPDGAKVSHLRFGAHAMRRRWDADKRVLEVTCLDEGGHVRPAKGVSFAILRRTFDARGREVTSESLDAAANRIPKRGAGAAAVRVSWSDADDETERAYLAPGGDPVPSSDDYARRETVHDARGLEIEWRYFDEAGHPVAWKEGDAVERATYDERMLVTSRSQFDGAGKPSVDRHGVHEVRFKYDRLRDEVERAYFGVDGRPTTNDEGISVVRRTYDDAGDLVARAYFDETGAPAMYRGELAVQRFTSDDRGLRLSSEALDTHGERTLRREGYAVLRRLRDRNGDVTEEATFGKHDEPIARAAGYARRTMTYDEHRRLAAVALFDVSGAPTPGAEGWSIERTTYDDCGLIARVDHLDAAGHPVLARDGAASIARSWDGRGNLVEEKLLGVDGAPVVASGGYASRKNEYDERDQLVTESLFGADGAPTAGRDGWSVRRVRYDDVGNVVEESTFDASRAPVVPRGAAHASLRHRFDARQRLVETSYFDVTGAPVAGPDGAATVRYERDVFGRPTLTSWFDRTGTPAPSKEGKIAVRTSYDATGHVGEEQYLDGAGAPRAALDGCSGRRFKYDVYGRRTEDACLDAKGGLTTSTDGFAVQRIVHDGRGNDVEVSTYGADGALCLDKEGIALRRSRYDERNMVVETSYFDAGERPTHDKRGVHLTRFTYADGGKPLPATYLDERGRPVSAASFTPAPASNGVDLAFGEDALR